MPEPFSIYILHVLFVFMTSILLLNFLIAVFSDSVNNVNMNHDVIYGIQRLSVMKVVECRVDWLFRKWFIYNLKKHLIWHDGKVYLAVQHPS